MSENKMLNLSEPIYTCFDQLCQTMDRLEFQFVGVCNEMNICSEKYFHLKIHEATRLPCAARCTNPREIDLSVQKRHIFSQVFVSKSSGTHMRMIVWALRSKSGLLAYPTKKLFTYRVELRRMGDRPFSDTHTSKDKHPRLYYRIKKIVYDVVRSGGDATEAMCALRALQYIPPLEKKDLWPTPKKLKDRVRYWRPKVQSKLYYDTTVPVREDCSLSSKKSQLGSKTTVAKKNDTKAKKDHCVVATVVAEKPLPRKFSGFFVYGKRKAKRSRNQTDFDTDKTLSSSELSDRSKKARLIKTDVDAIEMECSVSTIRKDKMQRGQFVVTLETQTQNNMTLSQKCTVDKGQGTKFCLQANDAHALHILLQKAISKF